MNYTNFKCEDFLEDNSFQSYIRKEKEEDIMFWENWIAQDPGNLPELRKASRILQDIQDTYRLEISIDKQKELTRLLGKIEEKEPDMFKQYQKEQWIKIAAIFILLIGLGFVFKNLFTTDKNKGREHYAYKEVKTPKGKRLHIQLSDGTQIWVNSESTIKYPQVFNGDDRKVYLEGEAYFDVTEDKTKPFFVYAGEIRVKVLGTSFNVRSYPEDDFVETTLEKGKINIERIGTDVNSEIISMTPNQKVTLYKAGHQPQVANEAPATTQEMRKIEGKTAIIAKDIETDLYTSWKDEKLVFRGEQLEKLKLRLERWYNVPIVVKDSELLKKKLTGTFVKEPIKEALRALSVASEFEFEIKNDTVYLMTEIKY